MAGLEPFSTESYVLKLLVEVGLLGALPIVAFLAWALFAFFRLAWRAKGSPELQSLAAAGIGLSAYALVFPTLEAQLTALTWWLLIMLALKTLQDLPARVGAPLAKARTAQPPASRTRSPADDRCSFACRRGGQSRHLGTVRGRGRGRTGSRALTAAVAQSRRARPMRSLVSMWKPLVLRYAPTLVYSHPVSSLAPERLYAYMDALWERRELDGAVVEVGSYLGGTAALAHRLLENIGHPKRYVCVDTFGGFVPDQFARDEEAGISPRCRNEFSANAIETVRKLMRHYGCSGIELIRSDIAQLNPSKLPEAIAVCLVDVDLDVPVYAALERVLPRVVPGGVVLVDDCDEESRYTGARTGYSRFAAEHGLPEQYFLGFGVVEHERAPRGADVFPTSEGAAAAEHGSEREGENPYIPAERQIFDVLALDRQPLLESELSPAVDLHGAGDPGLRPQTKSFFRRVTQNEIELLGTRSDEAHLSAQDVQ